MEDNRERILEKILSLGIESSVEQKELRDRILVELITEAADRLEELL